MNEEKQFIEAEPAVELKQPGPLAIFGAVISYLGVLSLIPLVIKVKNPFIQHHLKQGLLLFGIEVVLVLIGVIPLIGWIVGVFGWIFCALFSLIGVFNAIAGRYWRLPWLNKYAEKIKI